MTKAVLTRSAVRTIGAAGSDRPVIVAYLMIIVLMFITINLVVDLTYSLLDPRVRLESKGT